jgi:hypothetical protein
MNDAKLPYKVACEGSTAIIRFSTSLAQVDLETGAFSLHPLGSVELIGLFDRRVLMLDGGPNPRLVVFDTTRGEFTSELPSRPARVPLLACCGVEVLGLGSRMTATMPGPLLGSPVEIVRSGCGAFAWLEVAPGSDDDVGIFSVERLETQFQPWPHPVLALVEKSVVDDEYDETPRALGKVPSGPFRFLYGAFVCQGDAAHPLGATPLAAAFDAAAAVLTTIDDRFLRRYRLDDRGEPTLEQAWALAPLLAHLDPRPLIGPEDDADEVMGVAGTVDALIHMSRAELEELLPQLDPELLAAQAKQVKLSFTLDRAS